MLNHICAVRAHPLDLRFASRAAVVWHDESRLNPRGGNLSTTVWETVSLVVGSVCCQNYTSAYFSMRCAHPIIQHGSHTFSWGNLIIFAFVGDFRTEQSSERVAFEGHIFQSKLRPLTHSEKHTNFTRWQNTSTIHLNICLIVRACDSLLC